MIIPVVALAAVGGVLTTAVIASRGMSHQASALEQFIRSDLNVASGLRRLVAAFADPADGLELVALAGGADIEVGKASLTLRVEPEAGKIDVVQSDEQLVRRYLSQAGGDTDAIWPKLSHLRQTGDGEATFQAIALALAEVRGVESLRQDLTWFGAGPIDPQFASTAVLASIPDLSPTQVSMIAAMPPTERASVVPLSRYFAAGGRTFTVRASDQGNGRRLPIEVSNAGLLVALAGMQP